MKNRNNFIKFMFISGILLLILFLITLFSLIKVFFIKEKMQTKEIIEVNYKLDSVNTLAFDFNHANVVFKTTNNEDLTIIQNTKEEKLYLNINKYNNKITVDEDSILFNGNEKKYTIRIPKSYLGSIVITNGFGKINLYNLKSGLYIDNNAGEVNVFKSNDINIKDVSGTLNLTDIEGNIVLSSSTGNINIKNVKGLLNIDTLTGDIIVNNFKIEGNSKIENISGDISLIINRDSICKIKASNQSGESNIDKSICSSKKNILEVENITGNINIK